jgi:hypothetical protein
LGYRAARAFSSEVDAGSRQENASKRRNRAYVPIQSERKRLWRTPTRGFCTKTGVFSAFKAAAWEGRVLTSGLPPAQGGIGRQQAACSPRLGWLGSVGGPDAGAGGGECQAKYK